MKNIFFSLNQTLTLPVLRNLNENFDKFNLIYLLILKSKIPENEEF